MSGKTTGRKKPKNPDSVIGGRRRIKNRRFAVAEQRTYLGQMEELGTRLKLASIIGG